LKARCAGAPTPVYGLQTVYHKSQGVKAHSGAAGREILEDMKADFLEQAATKISVRLALALLDEIDKPSAGKGKQSGTSIDSDVDDAAERCDGKSPDRPKKGKLCTLSRSNPS
jgi:hypothetical protein